MPKPILCFRVLHLTGYRVQRVSGCCIKTKRPVLTISNTGCFLILVGVYSQNAFISKFFGFSALPLFILLLSLDNSPHSSLRFVPL